MGSTHDRQARVHRKPFAAFEYVGNRKFFLAIAREGTWRGDVFPRYSEYRCKLPAGGTIYRAAPVKGKLQAR